MRICIYGAGATGGHLAVRLAGAGHDVAVIARGPHLQAIRAHGLALRMGERMLHARPAASEHPAELGPQDLVISTLKSTALHTLAQHAAPLLGADTPVVFAQNGIPWWYASGARTGVPPDTLAMLDPGGALATGIGLRRVLGAVIQSSNIVLEPGVVQNDSVDSNMLTVGEIDDRASDRVTMLRGVLAGAGITSPVTDDLRRTLWTKLVVNLSISTLSMLTAEPATIVATDPDAAGLCERLMREAIAIAASQGVALDIAQYERWRTSPPDHRPSILQDYELGRPMEIDSIIRAPLALARAAGVPTPALDTIAALATTRARRRGLYR